MLTQSRWYPGALGAQCTTEAALHRLCALRHLGRTSAAGPHLPCISLVSRRQVLISSFGDGVLADYTNLTDAEMDHVNELLSKAVLFLPIVLALVVTIASRMGWRDKWSVCVMAADSIAAEIYKFRLGTCEYDMAVPPGKDADGNDLPPLSSKEKARRARMLFVERIQVSMPMLSTC